MTVKQTKKLQILYKKGCTDSDIEDFCQENGISTKEAFWQIADWKAPVCCKGCKYVESYASMMPCMLCSRSKDDKYEEK